MNHFSFLQSSQALQTTQTNLIENQLMELFAFSHFSNGPFQQTDNQNNQVSDTLLQTVNHSAVILGNSLCESQQCTSSLSGTLFSNNPTPQEGYSNVIAKIQQRKAECKN